MKSEDRFKTVSANFVRLQRMMIRKVLLGGLRMIVDLVNELIVSTNSWLGKNAS